MSLRKIRSLLISVCLGLLGLAVAPIPAAAYKVYVTNEGSNTVSVIDTATNTVIATIPVGVHPRPLNVSPDGKWVYVVNFNTDIGFTICTISAINTATDMVEATITAGTGPTRIAFSLDSTVAYAVNEGSDNITVIDTATKTVVRTVPTGRAPRCCAATPDGIYGVVINQLGTDVWVFDGTTPSNPTVAAKIDVGFNPQLAGITPDGAFLYVFNGSPNADIVVIDMATFAIRTRISNVGTLQGAAIRPDGAFLYVMMSGSNTVSLIDTNPASPTFNTVVDRVAIGTSPLTGGGFTPDGALLGATNTSLQLLGLDTNPASATYHTVVGTLPLPGLTGDDRGGVTPDSAFLYLTNRTSNRVQAIDLDPAVFDVVANIPVGTSPTHLEITPF